MAGNGGHRPRVIIPILLSDDDAYTLEPAFIGCSIVYKCPQHRFLEIMSSQCDTRSTAGAVGLSDPQYAARRKRTFEFLIRVRAIGYVSLLRLPAGNHGFTLY